MKTQSSRKSVDLQELITEAARVELKALNAGIECWQVFINQVAKFSNIAGDTLEAVQDDKASLSDAARRLTAFGKENTDVLRDLSGRLSKRYFDELDRLATFIGDGEAKSAKKRATAKKARRKSSQAKDAHPSA